MQLKEAHDIGESLQKKIEDLPGVELVCFFFKIEMFLYSSYLGICSC
jgi:hypothetical protein